MFERSITVDEVRSVLASGELVEDYPDDTPYPSRLLLGRPASRALHVVAADVTGRDETIIITAYEPDPTLWELDFKRRKP
jgi:hypothetical protein